MEKKHLNQVLKSNGYPSKFIYRHNKGSSKEHDENPEPPKGYAVLPYVKGATEKIQRVLHGFKIKSAAKPVSTLKGLLSRPKDPVPQEQKTGVIYQIPCQDCDVVYIGETGRAFATRKKEHMTCVRLDKCDKSALADHANHTGHDIAWQESSILAQEPRWIQRRWLEAIKISKNKNCLFNKNSGRTLPDSYKELLTH